MSTTVFDATPTAPERVAPHPLATDPRPAAAPTPARGAVAVAATFTAEMLQAPLAHMLQAAELSMEVRFAPYHQVFQELLTPGSTLAKNAGGVNAVLVRIEDFVRDAGPGADAAQLLSQTVDGLVEAAGNYARRSAIPAVFVVFAPSPSVAPALRPAVQEASARLLESLGRVSGIVVLDAAQVDALCAGERFDAAADRLAHIPFTEEYFAALAIVLSRRVHMLVVPAHKVLVLDCDNTIWNGVVGEEGPHGIRFDDAFVAVQRFAVQAQAKGVLVALASKNVEADVLEVFGCRSEMVLRPEHLVCHRINWEAKPSNLRSMARQLNLGLDSFVFIDDNPVECGHMREAAPEVVTLQLPPPGEVAGFLDNLWVFDKATVTQEDARRTAMYLENAARDSLEAQAADIGEFLAALQLEVDIAQPAEDDWPRVSQLTHRTNQFNFTTVRRSEAEMRALAAEGVTVLSVRVRDRFGDYGLVGVVIARRGEAALEVDTFLLSCRVLGRGVEHRIVAHLGQLAASMGLAQVKLPFRRTAKNEPARAFADSIVATYRVGDGDAFDYLVPAAAAAAVTHRPGEDAAEVIEARRSDEKKAAKPARSEAAGRSLRYQRLATELTSGAALVAALGAAATRQRDLDTAVEAPRSSTERTLLALWEETLGVRGLGVEDDFFALGGSSLQAARLFAEIVRRFGVDVPMTTILKAPTVRRLAPFVENGGVVDAGGLVPLRSGGSRTLFLVHDGDGETLLYRNLARRVPSDVSVFGIQPERLSGVPLAHTRIEAMAASYVARVREVQPHGPYLLGGMCAGGLIAYEMAVQLSRAGEPVETVLMMDSATPQAPRRGGLVGAQRKARLGAALAEARQGGPLAAAAGIARVLARKVIGAASYEIARVVRGAGVKLRFAVLQRVLAGGRRWPAFLPALDFRAIYNAAEARYVPQASDRIPAVLVRAASGTGNDTAYCQIYSDPSLGWQSVARRLEVVDVDGGHSSMLQEPHAARLSEAVAPYLSGRRT